jgi:peptidoglycan lytic transglycosylase G
MKKLLVWIIFFAGLIAAGIYVRRELSTPYLAPGGPLVLEIPRGMQARDLVGLLEEKKVIRNRYVTLVYVFYRGLRRKLQAGEYLFDQPMTPVEVVARIASGNVLLHKFTVPEGLTVEEISQKWEDQGFGSSEDFKKAAGESVSLVQDLDPKATTVEGFLFPETYSFPAHTTAQQAIEAMTSRFRNMTRKLESDVPRQQWPLDLRGTVILASLVESEAAKDEERPLVASVYLNRIVRKILLQCDPTVIYALERADQYKGRLTRADLKFSSPYNTYVNPGLPPGPITNPGYASLHAAVQPASTRYLFFVRTVEGRHTFSENLAAHNRAVAALRLLERQKKN